MWILLIDFCEFKLKSIDTTLQPQTEPLSRQVSSPELWHINIYVRSTTDPSSNGSATSHSLISSVVIDPSTSSQSLITPEHGL